MWVPNGNVKFGGSWKVVASMPGSTPSGSDAATQAEVPSSWIVRVDSDEPFTLQCPSLHSRSSTEHSSSWAAIWRAFSLILSIDRYSAVPATASDREPYVPSP